MDTKVEGQKIEIIPYLSFQGNCEEVVHTYIDIFGGEIAKMTYWSADRADIPSEQIGKVMYAEFRVGSVRMEAKDTVDCAEGNTDRQLMVHMDTEAEALYTVFALAEGGCVLLPLAPHQESDDDVCRSVIKDRFGIIWIITCPDPTKQYYADGIVWLD